MEPKVQKKQHHHPDFGHVEVDTSEIDKLFKMRRKDFHMHVRSPFVIFLIVLLILALILTAKTGIQFWVYYCILIAVIALFYYALNRQLINYQLQNLKKK